MIIRKIGGLLRGRATPGQLLMACLLGAAIGFMPGFAEAPGMILAVTLLLIVLNANLFVAAAVALICTPLSWLLLPVSFHLGRALIDGPTAPVFEALINAPVLAFFGFEYYVVTGGVPVAAVVGLLLAWALIAALRAFRRRMARLEEGSQRYQTWTSRWWVRVLAFVFAGSGHGKQKYAQLLERRMGNPVRVLGVVLAVLVLALGGLVVMFAQGPIVAALLQDGLARANGATVDLEEAEVDLSGSRLTLRGLAMADPQRLERDIFRAATIEADISGLDLLRKRVRLDRVVVDEAQSGVDRRTRGRVVGRPDAPAPSPEPREPGDKTLEDYIEDAERWKQRLEQVRRWLEKVAGPGDEQAPAPERKKRVEDWVRQQIDNHGYAGARALHRIEGAPSFHIAELVVDRLRTDRLPDETLRVEATDLSTHPSLLDEPPVFRVRSSAGRLDLLITLFAAVHRDRPNRVLAELRGLDADAVGRRLKLGSDRPLAGGTIDLRTDGTWNSLTGVNLPLEAVLRESTITVPGVGAEKVERLALRMLAYGPVSAPRVRIDRDGLAQALKSAGAEKIAGRFRGEAEGLIEKGTEKLGAELGDELGGDVGRAIDEKARGLLGGLLKKRSESRSDSNSKGER